MQVCRPLLQRTLLSRCLSTAAPAIPAAQLPTELLPIILASIKAHGPMPLNRYMKLCLSHPTLGYYTRMRSVAGSRDQVLGKQGDFITSPEISQVFGEVCLGVCSALQIAFLFCA